MLNVNRTINLNGTSNIDGVPAVFMSASIQSNGSGVTATKNITNQELYNANKAECRKDVADFESEIYKIEDDLVKEVTAQNLILEKRGR